MERISPLCFTSSFSHSGIDSIGLATVDSLPSAGCHVTDLSRSHTPPERDVSSNGPGCTKMISIQSMVENVSSQGV